jgi:hypothetical protein
MKLNENMLIKKEDMIDKKEVIYKEKTLPYIDLFENLIKKGGGKTEIRMKDIRNILGWEELKNKSDMTLYSRLKDILLENGIKIRLHHHYGANLVMAFVSDESEIINGTEVGRLRRENTAKNSGFLNWTEYRRRLKSHIDVHGVYAENGSGKFYSVNIGRQFIAPILFPGCVINEKSIDRYSLGGYDWTTNNGIKVKNIITHLKHSVDKEGFERDYFQWNIYENDVADIFVLTGWGNGDGLELELELELIKGWIFDKEEIVNGRKFWKRMSFLISTHKRSILKYSKFEIDNDKLEVIKKKIRDMEQIDVTYENIDVIDYRIEIAEWYSIVFRTVNWEK